MKKVMPLCIAVLMLLSSCGGENKDNSDKPSDTEQITLLLPDSRMYSLKGTDAVMFDAISQYSNDGLPKVDLSIPVLSLTGGYEDENGNQCCVVQCHLYTYFDLASRLNGTYSLDDLCPGEEISWICVTLADDDSVIDLAKSEDGSRWAQSVRELCGSLVDLANEIIDNKDPVTIRTFPKMDPDQLIQTYINAKE